MGQILNIWARRKVARLEYPVGSMVKVAMPQAWLDDKVGVVLGYDLYGSDVDLQIHVLPEDVKTTVPMKNCAKV